MWWCIIAISIDDFVATESPDYLFSQPRCMMTTFHWWRWCGESRQHYLRQAPRSHFITIRHFEKSRHCRETFDVSLPFIWNYENTVVVTITRCVHFFRWWNITTSFSLIITTFSWNRWWLRRHWWHFRWAAIIDIWNIITAEYYVADDEADYLLPRHLLIIAFFFDTLIINIFQMPGIFLVPKIFRFVADYFTM